MITTVVKCNEAGVPCGKAPTNPYPDLGLIAAAEAYASDTNVFPGTSIHVLAWQVQESPGWEAPKFKLKVEMQAPIAKASPCYSDEELGEYRA